MRSNGHGPSSMSKKRCTCHQNLASSSSFSNNDWLGWPSHPLLRVAARPHAHWFLVWLFVWHRDQYPHWRNGLVFLTGTCLVIRFWRVAPPRFLTDLGYKDLSEIFGPSIYGPVGTGVSDQFAAMPSIHVGWAAVVSFGVVSVSKVDGDGLRCCTSSSP